MGNQTLVPSQIQSVESYFNELKYFVKFKSSLGSTTFMKTAVVTLNDVFYLYEFNDFLINNKDLQQIKAYLASAINTTATNVNTSLQSNELLSSTVLNASQQQSLAGASTTQSSTAQQQQQQQQAALILQTQASLLSSNVDEIIQYLRELQHQIVVKVFPKYDLSIRFDLYGKRLRDIKQILYTRYGQCTNCLPFSNLIITDKAAFLFRQFVKYNLYDRLSTRPFLVDIEKKWIAFQIMSAVNEIHSLQIVHGDIKIENILINSFLWVSLTDFASYKPVYLSTNHPSADFNYYFDISRRRTCCLAPERFDKPTAFAANVYPSSGNLLMPNTDGSEHMPPNPNDFVCSMDMFSLGCVIAELFMERPLFDFARLISYKEGKYEPKQELMNEIADANIVQLILDMISIQPSQRHTINEYLQEQNDKAFPSYFVFLKNYISKYVNTKRSPDDIVLKLKYELPITLKYLKLNLDDGNNQCETDDAFLILLSLLLSTVRKLKYTKTKLIAIELMLTFSKFLSDSIILDRIIPYLISFISDYEQQPLLFKQQQQQQQTTTQAKQQQVFLQYQQQQQQQQNLAIIKSRVTYALNECLAQIKNIDLQNINIFPELIFDLLEKLSKDESYLVRSTIAKTISSFALTSIRYLDNSYLLIKHITQQQQQQTFNNAIVISQSGQSAGGLSSSQATTTASSPSAIASSTSPNSSTGGELNFTGSVDAAPVMYQQQQQQQDQRGSDNKIDELTYDKEYQNYQNRIMDIVLHLITDAAGSGASSTTTNAVKEVLLRSDISRLCAFLGRQKTSEFLLPHMITILNEKTDWSIRAAFFDALCPVLINIGWESVEIVKPLLEQGLKDSEEFVIHRTLLALAHMVDIGLFDRVQMRSFLSDHVAPLLCHPSLWIRHGAVNFISTICGQARKNTNNITMSSFSTADILCSIVPIINKFLKRTDLIEYDRPEILFSCLKTPIKRSIYDCVAQDGRSDHLFLFLNDRSRIRGLASHNYSPGYFDSPDPQIQFLFEKLCKLGLDEEDEEKLFSMKEFMEKTRMSRLSSSLHGVEFTATGQTVPVALTQLGQRKENFIQKDGCVSIIKDKYTNSIDLSARIAPTILTRRSFNNENSINDTNSLSTSPTSTVNNNDSSLNQSISADLSINQSFNSSSSSTTTTTNAKRTLNNELRASEIEQQQIMKKKFPLINHEIELKLSSDNCLNQFENFINRSKLIYDDLKNKQMKLKQMRSTVNSTITSHLVCLASTSSGTQTTTTSSALNSSTSSSNMVSVTLQQTPKWKPKGYLIVHSNEHTKNITKLCRNHDSSFFASCSTTESSIKLWSTDNLLDGKSGYFKSRFTYDRFTSGDNTTIRKPYCMTFFENTSLGILTEDFSFYKIDFNSNKRVYQLYNDQKIFKNSFCDCYTREKTRNELLSDQLDHKILSQPPYLGNRMQFYYLNNPIKTPVGCTCANRYKNNMIYPTEMIYIDDTCPSWPAAVKSSSDYYISSPVRGLFCYASNNGYLSCIDLRTRTKAFDIKHDLKKGYTTAMITDPWYTYLSLGTSNGCIDVYDFRFMVPMQSLQHRSRTSVVRMCSHPMNKNQIVASYQGNNEIAVWNVDSTSSNSNTSALSKSQFANTNPEFTFWGATQVPPLSQKGISNEYISGMFGVTSGVFDPPNSTNSQTQCALVCASTDMKIRYLDLNEPYRESFIVSSPLNRFPQPQQRLNNSIQLQVNPTIYYEMRQIEGSKVLVELEQSNTGQQINIATYNPSSLNAASSTSSTSNSTPVAHNSSALAYQSYCSHHQDAISDLIICYKTTHPTYQPFIVTSSRDGTLKVWR